MRRLIRPKTISGRIRLFSLIFYLSSSTIVLSQGKPSTAVSRTLQTRNFEADVKTTLKASINALQDLDYTIDVLNSDVGLITASRTTEEKKAEVSTDGVGTVQADLDNEEAVKEEQTQTCVKIIGIAFVAVFFVFLLGAIFGGDDDDDDDDGKNSNSSSRWRRSSGSSNTRNKTVNNYYQDDTPKGPRIYRYKVTINIDDSGSENTVVRVSASGELEQDGKILESGGIHEPEFFKRFFASMNKSLFLDENLPAN
tara:strand:+ start:7428 stop:8189 length:762 start_codon:yes stop_codon:yes gene_type:complete